MIAAQKAAAEYQQGIKSREVAEIIVREYKEGVFPQEEAALQNEIAEHQAALESAGERVKRADHARKRLAQLPVEVRDAADVTTLLGRLDLDDRIESNTLTVARERSALALTERKLKNLREFRKQRRVKEFEADVEKAKSAELALKQVYELERSKEDMIEIQINNCVIRAPIDGLLVYFRAPNQHLLFEVGATVHERQGLFRFPFLNSPMQVSMTVPESKIALIRTGQTARVHVDAFANLQMIGRVSQVSPLPDAKTSGDGRRTYIGFIALEKAYPGLRPDMTAPVTVEVDRVENVLSVPIAAVRWKNGRSRVAVQTAEGLMWREIVLGLSDGKFAEVKQGLREGDRVVLNPQVVGADDENARNAP
jgi:RND family efflux transporter MFP subunit